VPALSGAGKMIGGRRELLRNLPQHGDLTPPTDFSQAGVMRNLLKLPWKNGAQRRIRTTDTRIFSPLLYQLSYLGLFRHAGSSARRIS
jgi:hypothetical protein